MFPQPTMILKLVVLPLALGQAVPRPLPGNVDPVYPPAAQRRLVAGDVTFRAHVSAEGFVEDVLVLSIPAPGLGFEEAVRAAVRRWRFEPMAEPAYYLGTHSFRLRPVEEARLRELASSESPDRFHEVATVIAGGRIHRRTRGSWPAELDLSSLAGRVHSIDFAAGDAATVTLDVGAVLRVLKVDGAWRIISWEPDPAEIDLPERVETVLPVFPLEARNARSEDVVVLQALIDHEGVVRYLDVVSSVPELDRFALEAARQWRFRPARRAGVAFPFVMTLTVGFAGEPP